MGEEEALAPTTNPEEVYYISIFYRIIFQPVLLLLTTPEKMNTMGEEEALAPTTNPEEVYYISSIYETMY